MKKLYSTVIIFLLIFGGGPIGCSENAKYEIVVPKGHSTYMISRQGEFLPERFDTIFVFGHINNESIAIEITEYLNEQEPGEPFQYRKFDPGEEIKGP